MGARCKVWKDLSGKTAVVTGSSAGIGKMTALMLAQQGCKVIFACRDEKKTRGIMDWIQKQSNNTDLHFIKCDTTSFKIMDEFMKTLEERGIKVDFLANNAGIGSAPRKSKCIYKIIPMIFCANHLGH